MSDQIKYPDYTSCITNLVASILDNYGVEIKKKPLTGISERFKDRKNIILFILDGFGFNLLKRYRNDSLNFLKDQDCLKISSVFPPTTTAAISSFLSGLDPIEHGALGWTLFFKEFGRYIDFLPNWDTISHKYLDQKKYDSLNILTQENIFSRIKNVNPNLSLQYFTPDYIHDSAYTIKNSTPALIHPYSDLKDLFKKLQTNINESSQSKFIYAYSVNPDALEHRFGVYSKEVENFLQIFNEHLREFAAAVSGTNTTMLLTADHGLTDISDYKYTSDDPDLNQSLILPAFPEPRFVSLFVKNHKRSQFMNAISKYKNKFILFSRDEFLDSDLLGYGKAHEKIDDFIGDYVLIAKDDFAMKSIYKQNGRPDDEFKAHHAGITAAEMDIPLVFIDF